MRLPLYSFVLFLYLIPYTFLAQDTVERAQVPKSLNQKTTDSLSSIPAPVILIKDTLFFYKKFISFYQYRTPGRKDFK